MKCNQVIVTTIWRNNYRRSVVPLWSRTNSNQTCTFLSPTSLNRKNHALLKQKTCLETSVAICINLYFTINELRVGSDNILGVNSQNLAESTPYLFPTKVKSTTIHPHLAMKKNRGKLKMCLPPQILKSKKHRRYK